MPLIPSEDPDMENRDPNNINDDVKVIFEDILAEPDGAHSHECIWSLAFKCFTGGRNLCYLILTFLCAIPLSLCWGCQFACVTFLHVWQFMPCLRIYQIHAACARKYYMTFLSCYLAPICETVALCFSKINVTNQ